MQLERGVRNFKLPFQDRPTRLLGTRTTAWPVSAGQWVGRRWADVVSSSVSAVWGRRETRRWRV